MSSPGAPRSILQQIIDHKHAEIAAAQAQVSLAQLVAAAAAGPPVRPFAAALRRHDRATLIAEVKRASPSRGILVADFAPLTIARCYADHGAAALSVLTDERFFLGSLEFLRAIRRHTRSDGREMPPLLRKDFIIDPYQVYEARAAGADAILLIVAALADDRLTALLQLSQALGMDALVEVHDAAELERALALGATLVGINNRDLHTFVTSLATTEALAAGLDVAASITLVSESGIDSPADVARVRRAGAAAVLVGEALVTAADMAGKVRALAGE
jgi:indole-3-glycerol phosphate synthase